MTGVSSSSDSMRIYELAKLLNISSGELLKRMQDLGLSITTPLNSVDTDVVNQVLDDSRRHGGDGDQVDPEPVETQVDSSVDPLPAADVEWPIPLQPSQSAPDIFEQFSDPSDARISDELSDGQVDEPQPDGFDAQFPPSALRFPGSKSDLADHHESEDGTTPPQETHQPPDPDTDLADHHESEDGTTPPQETHQPPDPDTDLADHHESEDGTTPPQETHQPPDPDTDLADHHEPGEEKDGGSNRSVVGRFRGLPAPYRILFWGAVIVVGTMMVTTLYALFQPTRAAAESDVVVSISGLGGEQIQRQLESLNVVAQSQTVLAPVSEQFNISVAELRQSFSSRIVGGSTILRFTVTASDPDTALAIDEAIVASYLEVANRPSGQDELRFVESQIELLESQAAELDSELATLEAEEGANAATRLHIESQRNVAQAQLAILEGRLFDLRAAEAAPPGSITFVEGEIEGVEARLAEIVMEGQSLELTDSATRSAANGLRNERAVLRSELQELQTLKVGIELDQIAATRVAVLAPAHTIDSAAGLTPVRAAALGLLVGGAMAVTWVVIATQFGRRE